MLVCKSHAACTSDGHPRAVPPPLPSIAPPPPGPPLLPGVPHRYRLQPPGTIGSTPPTGGTQHSVIKVHFFPGIHGATLMQPGPHTHKQQWRSRSNGRISALVWWARARLSFFSPGPPCTRTYSHCSNLPKCPYELLLIGYIPHYFYKPLHPNLQITITFWAYTSVLIEYGSQLW